MDPQNKNDSLPVPIVEVTKEQVLDVYRNGGIAPVLAQIKDAALSTEIDISTPKGLKECASLAYKVSRTKTWLDDIGKDVAEDARKLVDSVNVTRRTIRETLDALRDEIRRPVAEAEEREKTRVKGHEEALRRIREAGEVQCATSAECATQIARLETVETGEDWEEFRDKAISWKVQAIEKLQALRDLLKESEERARREAEEAKLRAEKERVEREERIRREAAEQATREAEEKARLEREETERKAREERERAEREKQEAEEKARKAVEDARREAEESKNKAVLQATLEARRQEQERRDAELEEIERARRETNVAPAPNPSETNRARREAYEDLCQILLDFEHEFPPNFPAIAGRIVTRIDEGRVRNVKIIPKQGS
jgi:colicin import membrane protein